MVLISQSLVPFDTNFGYVMIAIALIAIQIPMMAAIFGRSARSVFSEEYMKKNYNQIHQEAFGEDIGAGGLPDSGSGYYSQKLSYKEWYESNNRHRVYLNFLEFAPTYFALLAVAGVYFPITSASIGLALFILRILYGVGYSMKGPSGRVLPFLISLLLTMILFILGVLSGVQHIVK